MLKMRQVIHPETQVKPLHYVGNICGHKLPGEMKVISPIVLYPNPCELPEEKKGNIVAQVENFHHHSGVSSNVNTCHPAPIAVSLFLFL
jgi:hypothetical protein